MSPSPEPPVENPDQLSMLRSEDAALARNKRLVFDFWRIVFEGGHLDKAPEYMTESYVQHNPSVASGRAAFVELFSKVRPARPIAPRIRVPVVSITAEHWDSSELWVNGRPPGAEFFV